jgi:hypothetical protein
MLKAIKNYLVELLWSGREDDRRRETAVQDRARMLEMDEPMAGAGAQLSGMHAHSETEDELRRAASHEAE